MELIKKIITFGVLPLLVVALAVWAFVGTAGSEDYSYQGYIVAVRQTDDGTVITTLSGETQSEFVIKKTTKQVFNGELKELKECAFIRLSTKRGSDTQVKRFSAYEGYCMEGKILYLEGQTYPSILTIDPSYNYNMLYTLIPSQDISYQLETGTQVKAYYQYPLNASTEKVVVDVIQVTSDTLSPLTEDELAYLERMGHTVASK